VNRDDPVFAAVKDVLTEMYGVQPVMTRSGGSVPATGMFLDEFGVETITLGWSLPDSKAHAPNEWTTVSSFLRGREGYAMLLDRLKR
jgi:acetylornithine deacetylase/succinyl-diaminopimelate desuccinylase-like protein